MLEPVVPLNKYITMCNHLGRLQFSRIPPLWFPFALCEGFFGTCLEVWQDPTFPAGAQLPDNVGAPI